jgi:hypothetical protein
MTSVLAYGLLAPKGLKLTGFAVASAQAAALADVLGGGGRSKISGFYTNFL